MGQPLAVRVLRRAVTAGEISHAWLFVGPAGVGQREAARALAADLNCNRRVSGQSPDRSSHPAGENPHGEHEVEESAEERRDAVADAAPEQACGACSTCRRVMSGTHPAVIDLHPEGASHVVGSVREEWIPMATRTLVEGRRRVMRVVDADRMNEAAQNAFLKILEEPPAAVVWILEVTDESALLETVVSRCRRVDFAPWGPTELTRRATQLNIPPADRQPLVRAAMGSPRRLADLADPDVAAARERHLGVVGRLVDEGPGVALPLAADIDAWAKGRRRARKRACDAERERLEEAFGGEWPPGVKPRLTTRFRRVQREERRRALRTALDDLASYLRDLLALAEGADVEHVINVDHLDELRRDAARLSVPVVLAGLEAVRDCRAALDAHGQPTLHLERLLLRLGVAIYQARRA